MFRRFVFAALSAMTMLSLAACSSTPSDVKATEEDDNNMTLSGSSNKERLFNYITEIYDTGKTISGQMDLTWAPGVDMAQTVYEDTGRYPAIMGYDFMNYTCSCNNTDQTNEALSWWKDAKGTGKHGIVTFCWHWRNPLNPDKRESSSDDNFYTKGTSFRIPFENGKLNESSEAFVAIKKDLDTVAKELTILKNAGVPVLWRPLHEASGGWFWWGASGKDAYIALYRYMYDYFTQEKGLDNLIWVWNGQSAQWYPGDSYCDVISWDEYDSSKFDADYKALVEMGTDKVIALSENGPIPKEPYGMNCNWAWFMTWNDSGDAGNDNEDGDFWSNEKYNTLSHRKEIYNHNDVRTLDELPDFTQAQ